MNKKFVILNIILTFLSGFLVHAIYGWFPNSITSIFPVNESLYEHIKLIFYSPIIASTILYFIFKYRGEKINNIVFGLLVSTIFNIFIFYLIYLPIYHAYGANLLITLIIYFITICLSGYLYYLIINIPNNKRLNLISGVLIIISMFVLTYFTYHPIKIDFFIDPEDNIYGIKK